MRVGEMSPIHIYIIWLFEGARDSQGRVPQQAAKLAAKLAKVPRRLLIVFLVRSVRCAAAVCL